MFRRVIELLYSYTVIQFYMSFFGCIIQKAGERSFGVGAAARESCLVLLKVVRLAGLQAAL